MTEETREHSFDELARGLASGEVSRRKALKWMATAALGGTLFSIPGMALATPRTPPSGKGGCTGGRTLCRGKCYDLQTSNQNCGQCGNVCSESQVCQGGTCLGACSTRFDCAVGFDCIRGACVSRSVCQPGEVAECSSHGYSCCPGDREGVFACCASGTHCTGAGTSQNFCEPDV